jgi:hypothetical protein
MKIGYYAEVIRAYEKLVSMKHERNTFLTSIAIGNGRIENSKAFKLWTRKSLFMLGIAM